ncbi:conserved hypothetical protein [Kribbella flavida DSM 17836]|uniref:Uncharacterized protein n=1 Tax=Kribbella flavida (strain DSM 17836 / JCM 10339 / NBRC 14399) TaxID=479435 RepID=D2PNS1_KRIFD|nr:DUF6510 family protein [Kribbella flavida]ADB32739.1 conserved hypothetical protein [Kribbella flavida DSM 17836]
MSADVPTHLDGNAAAGALRELFAVDVTTAIARCAGCGRTGVFAEARLYADAPGLVARCPGCEDVLLRVVTTPSDTYFDLRGLTYLRLPNTP